MLEKDKVFNAALNGYKKIKRALRAFCRLRITFATVSFVVVILFPLHDTGCRDKVFPHRLAIIAFLVVCP